MNTDDTIENTNLKLLQGTMPEKYISMRRYYRTPEKAFIKENRIVLSEIIGNCVFCKISILLLILLSFIVVRPSKNQHVIPSQELNTVQLVSDTLRLSMLNHR